MHETRGRRARIRCRKIMRHRALTHNWTRASPFQGNFLIAQNYESYNKKKTAHSGIEHLGFVRAFEYLAANFLSHQTIRFQRASFTQMFRPFERGRKKEYFTMRVRENFSRNLSPPHLRPTTKYDLWSLSRADRSDDLNITEVVACRIISAFLPRDHCFRSIVTDYWASTHRVLKFFVSFYRSYLVFHNKRIKGWQIFKIMNM